MSKKEKLINAATHKISIWGYVATALSLLGYGGVQKIGIPASDKLAIEVNHIQEKQDEYIKRTEDVILILKVDMRLRFPEYMIDSMTKQVAFEMFWEKR